MSGAPLNSRSVRRHGNSLRSSIFLVLLSVLGCASIGDRQCQVLKGELEISVADLVKKVDHDSALERFLEIMEGPPSGYFPQFEYFEPEWKRLTEGLPADAEFWLFRSSKGSLGHDEGVLARRGCEVLGVIWLLQEN